MIGPAPLVAAPRYPFTAILCLAAATVSLGSMFGLSTDPFLLDERAFWSEPWRIILTTLPHGSVMHLFFNLYWTWVFGVAIEHVVGPRIWLLITIPAAVLASASQFALSQTPIGLSGVVYAFFTFLWVVSRRVPRLRPLVDRQTAMIFVAWFFICIWLSSSNTLNVANIAHGGGAVLGFVAGMALTSPPPRRQVITIFGGIAVALSLLAAGSSLRAFINPDGWGKAQARAAYELLDQGDALGAFTSLSHQRMQHPRNQHMEYAYIEVAFRAGKYKEALAALDEQSAAAPGAPSMSLLAIDAAAWCLDHREPEQAREFVRKAAVLDPHSAEPWVMLATMFESQGLPAAAVICLNRAMVLDPQNPDVADLLAAITRNQSLRLD